VNPDLQQVGPLNILPPHWAHLPAHWRSSTTELSSFSGRFGVLVSSGLTKGSSVTLLIVGRDLVLLGIVLVVLVSGDSNLEALTGLRSRTS